MIDVANEKKFTLRIPDDLHEQLKLIADQDMRSLHSQILVILREAAEARKPSGDAEPAAGFSMKYDTRKPKPR